MNAVNSGACGNPGPPNSGSSPIVPGKRIEHSPASQYIAPVNAAVRRPSRDCCAASSGEVGGERTGRQV
jgi:hypothetical protein